MAVDIHDLTGKRVLDREVPVADGDHDLVLDLGGELGSGRYMVSITAGNQRSTERLVITQ